MSVLIALAVANSGANAFCEILSSETAFHSKFAWAQPEGHSDSDQLFAWAEQRGEIETDLTKVVVSIGHYKTAEFKKREGPRTDRPNVLIPEVDVCPSGFPLGDKVKILANNSFTRLIAHANRHTVMVTYSSGKELSVKPTSLEFLARRCLARALGVDTKAGPSLSIGGRRVETRTDANGMAYAHVLQYAVAKDWSGGMGGFGVTFETPNRQVVMPFASNQIQVGEKWMPAGAFVFIHEDRPYVPLKFLQSL